ncbi:MAG TPA: lipopolysaccharide biosynthesis protein [Candidatus Limnocylindria bacterium]|nr:lipopolysaccharide biosynthesis protein [Candidatus Limnocylindria bacterium]
MKRGEIAESVSRGAFYLAIEKAAALLSGMAYFALLLRWLGPVGYGIMTLALSFVGLATMATGNFEVFLERYAAEYQTHGALRTLWRAHRLALLLKLALGAAASLVLVALAPVLSHQFATPQLALLLPVLAVIVASDAMATTGRATLYGMQEFRWICGLSVAFHVSKTVMVGALWGTRQSLVGLAIGLAVLTVLQAVAAAIVTAWILRRRMRDEPERPGSTPEGPSLLRQMVAYCTPLLGARMAFLSGQNLSRIVLGKLFEPALLGYFSFAFQTVERFVELVYTLPSSLLPSLTALVTRLERERLRFVFDQAFRLIILVACALSFCLFVFAPELTRVVGSRLFVPAVPLLQILALVPIFRTSQQPFTMLFQAMRHPGVVLTLALFKFATEFACYFLLVPLFGLQGAGWANLAGAVVSFMVGLVISARLLPEGADERARSVLTCWALLVPLLGIGYALWRWFPSATGLALRIALAVVGVVLVFAVGLVTRYDLEKLSSLPLRTPWSRRARDSFVASADRLVQAVAPRRAREP